MDTLSRTEELVLLAVYRLGAHAYSVSVRTLLAESFGYSLSLAAVYVPLERLAQRGLLSVTFGAPTAERGGRAKRLYHLTPAGIAALDAVRRLHHTVWAGIGELGAPLHE